MIFQTGDIVNNRYRIIEQLGSGGMAVVYLGHDKLLDRQVAIKFIQKDAIAIDALEIIQRRFEREAKALAKLSHNHIVSVFDFGDFQGSPFLVMEYLPCGSLAERMNMNIGLKETVDIISAIATALAHSHARGLIHRDIKPSNILFNENGEPKLADFGIGRIFDSNEKTNLTETGMGIGTPEYMSPEQGMGKAVDPRTDIYSLGVVFYEMATGTTPFEADTPMGVIAKHIYEPLPDPTTFRPGLPKILKKVLFKSMEKDPVNRFQTMDDLLQMLEGIPQPEMEDPTLKLQATWEDGLPDPTLKIEAVEGQPSSWWNRVPIWGWISGILGVLIIAVVIVMTGGDFGKQQERKNLTQMVVAMDQDGTMLPENEPAESTTNTPVPSQAPSLTPTIAVDPLQVINEDTNENGLASINVDSHEIFIRTSPSGDPLGTVRGAPVKVAYNDSNMILYIAPDIGYYPQVKVYQRKSLSEFIPIDRLKDDAWLFSPPTISWLDLSQIPRISSFPGTEFSIQITSIQPQTRVVLFLFSGGIPALETSHVELYDTGIAEVLIARIISLDEKDTAVSSETAQQENTYLTASALGQAILSECSQISPCADFSDNLLGSMISSLKNEEIQDADSWATKNQVEVPNLRGMTVAEVKSILEIEKIPVAHVYYVPSVDTPVGTVFASNASALNGPEDGITLLVSGYPQVKLNRVIPEDFYRTIVVDYEFFSKNGVLQNSTCSVKIEHKIGSIVTESVAEIQAKRKYNDSCPENWKDDVWIMLVDVFTGKTISSTGDGSDRIYMGANMNPASETISVLGLDLPVWQNTWYDTKYDDDGWRSEVKHQKYFDVATGILLKTNWLQIEYFSGYSNGKYYENWKGDYIVGNGLVTETNAPLGQGGTAATSPAITFNDWVSVGDNISIWSFGHIYEGVVSGASVIYQLEEEDWTKIGSLRFNFYPDGLPTAVGEIPGHLDIYYNDHDGNKQFLIDTKYTDDMVPNKENLARFLDYLQTMGIDSFQAEEIIHSISQQYEGALLSLSQSYGKLDKPVNNFLDSIKTGESDFALSGLKNLADAGVAFQSTQGSSYQFAGALASYACLAVLNLFR